VFDWKVPAKTEKARCDISIGGTTATVILAGGGKAGAWNRATLKSDQVAEATPIAFKPADGLEVMNVFVRELKENK